MASHWPGWAMYPPWWKSYNPPTEEKVEKEGPIGESQAAWGPQSSEGGRAQTAKGSLWPGLAAPKVLPDGPGYRKENRNVMT